MSWPKPQSKELPLEEARRIIAADGRRRFEAELPETFDLMVFVMGEPDIPSQSIRILPGGRWEYVG